MSLAVCLLPAHATTRAFILLVLLTGLAWLLLSFNACLLSDRNRHTTPSGKVVRLSFVLFALVVKSAEFSEWMNITLVLHCGRTEGLCRLTLLFSMLPKSFLHVLRLAPVAVLAVAMRIQVF